MACSAGKGRDYTDVFPRWVSNKGFTIIEDENGGYVVLHNDAVVCRTTSRSSVASIVRQIRRRYGMGYSDSILVCGSRTWKDYSIIFRILKEYKEMGYIHLIEGECRGADIMSRDAWTALGGKVVAVPAEWDRYGRAAGPIRNSKMLEMVPDVVIAFHGNLKESKGTIDTVSKATKMGLKVKIVGCSESETASVSSNSSAQGQLSTVAEGRQSS